MHYVEAFLTSMQMDLTITQYDTFDDLMVYVYGSAAVDSALSEWYVDIVRDSKAVSDHDPGR